MNKDIKYFGLDISHLFFDVTDSLGNYYQFKNSISGFKKFVKLLDVNSHCVMGSYGLLSLPVSVLFTRTRC